MWKPKPNTTYRDTESGLVVEVHDVPKTAGKSTSICEGLNVEVTVGGLKNVLPIIWFTKRRKTLEKVE